MGNRLYVAAVVLGWVASMAWLVSDRILPSFLAGDGPTARVADQLDPVAWRIEMDGKPCGMAVLQAVRGLGGSREVHSVLQVENLSAPESLPRWLTPVARAISGMSFSMRTALMFDSLGQLSTFETRLDSEGLGLPVKVDGRIRDDQLELRLSIAERMDRFTHPWPSNATFGGELTPTARLKPLYEGRRWVQEVYSPFAAPSQPIEMIEAVVKQRLRVTYDGESRDVWLVEFRSMEKTGSTKEGRVRATLWVDRSGRVLRQEAQRFGTRFAFIRESDNDSVAIAEEHLDLERYATSYAPPGKDPSSSTEAVEPRESATAR